MWLADVQSPWIKCHVMPCHVTGGRIYEHKPSIPLPSRVKKPNLLVGSIPAAF